MTHFRIFALALMGVFAFAPVANADIIITLTQSGTGVIASLSGSGIVADDGSSPGGVLNFNNFSGTPFVPPPAGFGAGTVFTLDTPLTISGTDANMGGTPYTSNITTIVLDNTGAGGSDVDLSGSFSIQGNDTYTASGSSTVSGLLFAQLNPGTYLSTDTDSADFGSVTLNIVAVPEPQTVALMFGVTVLALARVRRQRKADRQSESHA